MITITLEELVSSQTSLQKISSMQLPIAVSFKLARGIKQINEELKEFYEAQKKIGEKYGERDERGELKIDTKTGNIPISSEKQQEFQAELNALLAVEVKLNMDPININELESLNMSAQELYWLDKFIVM